MSKANIAARRWAGFYTASAAEQWHRDAVAAGPCTEHGLYACTGCSTDDSTAEVRHSGTPVADALWLVDKAQNAARVDMVRSAPGELTALRALAEAVRASLTTFSEGDVRTLAGTVLALWNVAGGQQPLTADQYGSITKARNVFGSAS